MCICEAIQPLDQPISVLVLRHPQEQDRVLGTAQLLTLQLKNAIIKTGLSWSSLSKILGKNVDSKKWGVLYLGSVKASAPLSHRVLTVVTSKGTPSPNQEEILASLEGIILLDGNWAQAKALWWRNPWLLKSRRLVLHPPKVSLYGSLRKEPRRESVSTLEAAAYALAELEQKPELVTHLLNPFHLLLRKVREAKGQTLSSKT